jgi:GTP-binding protein
VTPEAADAAVRAWSERLGDSVIATLATSAATGEGLDELRSQIVQGVPEEQAPPATDAPATHRVYRPAAGDAFHVERTGPGAFSVEGEGVERLIARHDIANDEALRLIENRLQAMGVIRALAAAGFTPGDDVEIAGTVFELDPSAPPRG